MIHPITTRRGEMLLESEGPKFGAKTRRHKSTRTLCASEIQYAVQSCNTVRYVSAQANRDRDPRNLPNLSAAGRTSELDRSTGIQLLKCQMGLAFVRALRGNEHSMVAGPGALQVAEIDSRDPQATFLVLRRSR